MIRLEGVPTLNLWAQLQDVICGKHVEFLSKAGKTTTVAKTFSTEARSEADLEASAIGAM